MTFELLERGVAALGALNNEVAFVGGATIVLWITDPGAPAPRPTKDVDVVLEVTTRAALHDFEERLRARGFAEDSSSSVICRWRHGSDTRDELILDAMPARANLIGFENRWQREGLPHAVWRELPSGARLRALTPPYLVATKLEAFEGRGRGDYLASHDLEDVVALVDGRDELTGEVRKSPVAVYDYVRQTLAALLEQPRFRDAIYGHLGPDSGSQARAESIVLPRLEALANPQRP